MAVTGGAYRIDNSVCLLEGAREIGSKDFDASNVVMVADAKTTKPEAPHRAFRRGNLAQLLDRDRVSIFESG